MHALLYTSSTYLGLLKGVTENKEAIVHGGRSIGLVKERLAGMTGRGEVVNEVLEGTVRAVSCLAISEVCTVSVLHFTLHFSFYFFVELRKGMIGF